MMLRHMLMLFLIFHMSHAYADIAPSAHIASPQHYEVLLDNSEVLVLRMVLKPGESDAWHSHKAETVYFEKGGKAEIKTSEGVMKLDIPDQHTMWHGAWEHQVSNVGDATIIAIIVEEK